MNRDQALLTYTLRLGDNALILGQRLAELVSHGPELEEELATANFALDYVGQARLFYSYAGEIEGVGRDEDDFAFLRDGHEFGNLLLVEQPNGHFGDTIARQVLFESFYVLQLDAMTRIADARLAAIASRAVKEIRYHLRHGCRWLVRLGDGTAESQRRVGEAVARLWRYTGEMFAGDEVDDCIRDEWQGPDLSRIREEWRERLRELFVEARVPMPEDDWMAGGGRRGVHTEHLGYLLAEMQFLQRAYPGASW